MRAKKLSLGFAVILQTNYLSAQQAEDEAGKTLEANLSGKFFRASLDRQQYYSFVGEAIGWLERKTP